MRRWTILNGILVVIVALLGVQIARTWGRALPAIDMTPRPVEPGGKPERGEKKGKRGGGAANVAPPQMVVAITNKDLFDPSRQKASEEAKAAPVVVVPPPTGITVVGVRIFGKDREAFIQDAAQGNKQRRVRTGDQISGHTVKSIDKKLVVLVAPTGESVELALQLDKKTAAGAPGKPAGPAKPAAPPPPTPPVAFPQAIPGLPTPPAGPGSPAAGVMGGGSPAGGVAKPPPAVAVPPPPLPSPTAGVTATTLPPVPAPLRDRLERLKQGRNSNKDR